MYTIITSQWSAQSRRAITKEGKWNVSVRAQQSSVVVCYYGASAFGRPQCVYVSMCIVRWLFLKSSVDNKSFSSLLRTSICSRITGSFQTDPWSLDAENVVNGWADQVMLLSFNLKISQKWRFCVRAITQNMGCRFVFKVEVLCKVYLKHQLSGKSPEVKCLHPLTCVS